MTNYRCGPPVYPVAFQHTGGLWERYRSEQLRQCWICHLSECANCGSSAQHWHCNAYTPQVDDVCCWCNRRITDAITSGVGYHELKTIPKYFEDILNNHKSFDIRLDDRQFQLRQALLLREWDGVGYSGAEILVPNIEYIVKHADFPDAIQPGYCVLGFTGAVYSRDLRRIEPEWQNKFY